MKLPSIIYAIVLTMAASVQAQDKATDPNEPSKPITPPGRIRNVLQPAVTIETDAQATSSIVSINMELSGRRLIDAIAEIESGPSGSGPGAQPMPNLIYSDADVHELPLPGRLRLTVASRVQAVALVCAAAGCTLEPIFAPAEEAVPPGASGLATQGKVIGYRIVPASTSGAYPMASRTPTPARTQPGGGANKSGSQKGTGAIAPEERSLFETNKESLMSPPLLYARSADTTERVVRVYALGSLLGRFDENSSVETQKRRQELIRAIQDLIYETMDKAEIKDVLSPDLAFNQSLRVFVAKATAAQHEIISQVIQALKENETVSAEANKVVPNADSQLATPTSSLSSPGKTKSNP